MQNMDTSERSRLSTGEKAICYDDLLVKHVGEFGKYQIILYVCVALIAIPAGFNNMGIVIIAGTPQHYCKVHDLENLSLSESVLKNLTIPRTSPIDGDKYESCLIFNRNYSGWTENDVNTCLQSGCNEGEEAVTCSEGWVYSKDEYQSTVVTQFNLVCGKHWLQAVFKSVFMAGLMSGVIIFGALADLAGRYPIFVVTLIAMVASSILQAFSPGITFFLVVRFLVGFFTMSIYTTGFVVVMELVGPSYRVHTGIAYQYFWAFGYMSFAAIGYCVRDWQTLQLITTVPVISLFFLIWVVPESPRWLYNKNKAEKANAIMRKTASINKTEFPDHISIKVENKTQGYIWDLIRTPRLRFRTIIICYNWFVNSVVYFGLSLNTSNLGGSSYLNFFISGAVEVPAYIFIQVALIYLGRRWTLSSVMVMGGVALMCTVLVPIRMNWVSVALAMLGKCGISASFALIYVYTAELYPTTIRNIAVSTGSFWARLAGVLAPYFSQLSVYATWAPLVLFGTMSVSAGLLIWLLPETKGKKLPETIEDGEKFGNERPEASGMVLEDGLNSN